MSESKKQNFLTGAAILAATVAIVKIIGALYKIPIGNILTDEGYAHFTVSYNIYSLLITISTAGLPVAVSRLVSASSALGRRGQVRQTFSMAKLLFFGIGIFGTLLMLIFPRQLADFMGDSEAALSITALAPAVFFVCSMSAYRGYAQGHSNMVPTAVSQIIEVVCKLVFGLALAWLAIDRGYGLPAAAAGAIIGVTIGEALAFLYLIYAKRRIDRDLDRPGSAADMRPTESRSRTLKNILRIGIPITVGSSILAILNLIDTHQLLSRLQSAAGFSYTDAKILTGVYGKAQTLFNLPSAFIVPVTVSVIPAISAYLAKNQYKEARLTVESSMRLATLMALPAGVGLCVLSYPIMNVLYPGSNANGPALLSTLGIASFFVCMTLMTNAVLQANGYERFTLYTLPIGGAIKIVLNYFLVGAPSINVLGAPFGTLVCYGLITLVNLVFIKVKLTEPPKLTKIFVKPAICTAVMGAAAYSVYSLSKKLLTSHISGSWMLEASSMIIAVIAAVIVYFILIIAVKAITGDDMKLLPRGEKLADKLKIR